MRIYNTMSRQKEELVPMTPGELKIYACGPTVYNYIQNFTDIDDKIINKANEENSDYLTVSHRYMEEYKKDAAGLNVRPATIHPLATEKIDEIIAIISKLVEKG